MPSTLPAVDDPRRQRWAWWPLLPLYPYGRRPTLFRELVPGRVWCFEQLHGVWYVAVPIRMTVLKVEGGLLLYAPIPATEEVISGLRALEREHGPVLSIVLATSSGLEHKIPVPALCRAFPTATLWVSDQQWSFPLRLPDSWLGFPAARTRVLLRDGVPHQEQLGWVPLGPIDLGLGTFLELACLDRETGSLLVTDALVAVSREPTDIYDLDPTPLLFHARERGADPLLDTPELRLRGWKRILLFANFFRPASVEVPPLTSILGDVMAATPRTARNHFGLYPFRWSDDWEVAADELLAGCTDGVGCLLAPVLERLVFVRSRQCFLDWLRELAEQHSCCRLIPAHYAAPQPLDGNQLADLADRIDRTAWAPSNGSWQLLASIDSALLRAGVIQ